jgi:hypothetical protein
MNSILRTIGLFASGASLLAIAVGLIGWIWRRFSVLTALAHEVPFVLPPAKILTDAAAVEAERSLFDAKALVLVKVKNRNKGAIASNITLAPGFPILYAQIRSHGGARSLTPVQDGVLLLGSLPATEQADVDLWTATPFTRPDDWKKFVIKHDNGIGRTRRLVPVLSTTSDLVDFVVFATILTAALVAFLVVLQLSRQYGF